MGIMWANKDEVALAERVIELANAALRGEITAEEWEAAISFLLPDEQD